MNGVHFIAFLFVVSVILASASLLRFIAHFIKYHWLQHARGVLLSTGIMFAFFNVSLKLAVQIHIHIHP